jgi:hypothetical protein
VLALALDAELPAMGVNGTRLILARDVFLTMLTSSLAPDEILIEDWFPAHRP